MHCINWFIMANYFCIQYATVQPLLDIYWNRSNEIFHGSSSSHTFEVPMKERIRFLCPQNHAAQASDEYYTIYRVPKYYYDTCSLPVDSQMQAMSVEMVMNCTSPSSRLFFTSPVERFWGLPGSHGGLVYQPGQTYFFTSISTGNLGGINNKLSEMSACNRYNMKAVVKVCCSDNATKAVAVEQPFGHQRESVNAFVHITRSTRLEPHRLAPDQPSHRLMQHTNSASREYTGIHDSPTKIPVFVLSTLPLSDSNLGVSSHTNSYKSLLLILSGILLRVYV